MNQEFNLTWVAQQIAAVIMHVESCPDAADRDNLAMKLKDCIMLAIKLSDEYKHP